MRERRSGSATTVGHHVGSRSHSAFMHRAARPAASIRLLADFAPVPPPLASSAVARAADAASQQRAVSASLRHGTMLRPVAAASTSVSAAIHIASSSKYASFPTAATGNVCNPRRKSRAPPMSSAAATATAVALPAARSARPCSTAAEAAEDAVATAAGRDSWPGAARRPASSATASDLRTRLTLLCSPQPSKATLGSSSSETELLSDAAAASSGRRHRRRTQAPSGEASAMSSTSASASAGPTMPPQPVASRSAFKRAPDGTRPDRASRHSSRRSRAPPAVSADSHAPRASASAARSPSPRPVAADGGGVGPPDGARDGAGPRIAPARELRPSRSSRAAASASSAAEAATRGGFLSSTSSTVSSAAAAARSSKTHSSRPRASLKAWTPLPPLPSLLLLLDDSKTAKLEATAARNRLLAAPTSR